MVLKLAEIFNVWRFHDERPLKNDEVFPILANDGTILEHKTNWFIGLTQQIVVVRKAL